MVSNFFVDAFGDGKINAEFSYDGNRKLCETPISVQLLCGKQTEEKISYIGGWATNIQNTPFSSFVVVDLIIRITN